jgi:hypothetical protein
VSWDFADGSFDYIDCDSRELAWRFIQTLPDNVVGIWIDDEQIQGWVP